MIVWLYRLIELLCCKYIFYASQRNRSRSNSNCDISDFQIIFKSPAIFINVSELKRTRRTNNSFGRYMRMKFFLDQQHSFISRQLIFGILTIIIFLKYLSDDLLFIKENLYSLVSAKKETAIMFVVECYIKNRNL